MISQKNHYSNPEPTIKLWSVQPLEAIDILKNKNFFISNVNFQKHWLDDQQAMWNWEKSYQWMTKHMIEKKIPNPFNAKTPVWAWAAYSENKNHPSKKRLKEEALLNNEKNVLLTLNVPTRYVLLSDFELWHNVLNAFPIAKNNHQERFFERKKIELTIDDDLKNDIVFKTWEQIFLLKNNFTKNKNNFTLKIPYAKESHFGDFRNRCTQACMFHINNEWIEKVTFLN